MGKSIHGQPTVGRPMNNRKVGCSTGYAGRTAQTRCARDNTTSLRANQELPREPMRYGIGRLTDLRRIVRWVASGKRGERVRRARELNHQPSERDDKIHRRRLRIGRHAPCDTRCANEARRVEHCDDQRERLPKAVRSLRFKNGGSRRRLSNRPATSLGAYGLAGVVVRLMTVRLPATTLRRRAMFNIASPRRGDRTAGTSAAASFGGFAVLDT